MKSLDVLPPHSVEAETTVLGCVLECPDTCLNLCREWMESGSEAFYDHRNAEVYDAMLSMDDAGITIDVVTLQEALLKNGMLERIGGVSRLLEIQDAAGSPKNLKYYLDIVQEKHLLRKVVSTCTELVATVYDYEGEIGPFIDDMERRILAIRPIRTSQTPELKKIVSESLRQIEEQWESQGKSVGLNTGFVDLDRACGGLRSGEMTVVAGYPGSGKTSFAMNVGENALLKQNKKVGVFSLEMSAVSLVTRFICSHAKINLSNVRKGFVTPRDFDSMRNSALSISKSAIWFEDESDLSIHQLRAKARRLSQQHGIELLIVDYLQLLTATGGARKVENRQQEVADISRGIKALSRELKIPVIALSQLNDDGRLRESRAIGQDADNVWVLQTTGKDNESESETEMVDLVIAKARNGPRCKVPLVFIKPYTRFENAEEKKPDKKDYAKPYND